MRKYLMIMIMLIMTILILSTVVYGWFTYVQRKAVTTIISNELVVDVKLNQETLIDTKTLSNLAFIDFEDDLINDTNKGFNEVGQVVDFKVTLSENSPLSRFIFELDPIDQNLIYLIILDDQTVDYHQVISQIINPLDTKENILLSISNYNLSQINALSNQIIIPGQTQTFKMIFWGDYDRLTNPELYLDYTANIAVKLTVINAYGDLS